MQSSLFICKHAPPCKKKKKVLTLQSVIFSICIMFISSLFLYAYIHKSHDNINRPWEILNPVKQCVKRLISV